MSLPALLSELATLLPERFFLGTPDMDDTGAGKVGYWVRFPDCIAFVEDAEQPSSWSYVLTACTLEAEARGWIWSVFQYRTGGYGSEVQRPFPSRPSLHSALTPAEALAAAMLAALKAEKGEG